MNNIVYIAGPITNTPNYRQNFATIEAKLANRGDIVFNPSTMPEGLPWEAYMPIYLMHGWRDSKGAKMEYEYAVAKGMKIMFESEVET